MTYKSNVDMQNRIYELENTILDIRASLPLVDNMSMNTFICLVDGRLTEVFGAKTLKDKLEEKKIEMLTKYGIFGKVRG